MSALWQREDRDPASEGGGVGTPEDSIREDIFSPISDEMLFLSILLRSSHIKNRGKEEAGLFKRPADRQRGGSLMAKGSPFA